MAEPSSTPRTVGAKRGPPDAPRPRGQILPWTAGECPRLARRCSPSRRESDVQSRGAGPPSSCRAGEGRAAGRGGGTRFSAGSLRRTVASSGGQRAQPLCRSGAAARRSRPGRRESVVAEQPSWDSPRGPPPPEAEPDVPRRGRAPRSPSSGARGILSREVNVGSGYVLSPRQSIRRGSPLPRRRHRAQDNPTPTKGGAHDVRED